MSDGSVQKPAPKVAVIGVERCDDIYFDGVHSLGEFRDSYQLELYTIRNIPMSDGTVLRRNIAVGGLRCTRSALIELVNCARQALSLGEKAAQAREEANGGDKPHEPTAQPKHGKGKKAEKAAVQ